MGIIANTISRTCRELSLILNKANNKKEKKESLLSQFSSSSHQSNKTNNERYSKQYISHNIEMNLMTEQPKRNTVKEIKNNKLSLLDFEVLKLIGAGTFGKVFLVRELKQNLTPKLFAMKILEKDKIIELDQVQNTLTEREILEKISHPFISKLCYAFQDINKLYLLTEFMPGGDLMHRLTSFGKLNECQAKLYACEIFLALDFLHKNNIIFRDLKPENILLDREGHIKLTDFGLSKKFTNSDCIINKTQKITFSICGTFQYIAPEVYEGMGYAQEIDWWSYGIVLYEMLTGKFPFKKDPLTHKIIPRLVFNDKVKVSLDAKDLIERLLDQNVHKRLFNPELIKKHKFFDDINWDNVYNKKYQIMSTNKKNKVEENFESKYLNNKKEVIMINEQKEGHSLHNRDDSCFTFLNFSFCENEEITA